MYETELEMGQ